MTPERKKEMESVKRRRAGKIAAALRKANVRDTGGFSNRSALPAHFLHVDEQKRKGEL